MKFSTHQKLKRQRGSILFIMIMILVALTVITFVATNMGKTDVQISNAYAEQSKSFIKAEEMFSRLRFAVEQIPLPEGVAVEGKANKTNRPIWLTPSLAKDANPAGVTTGEPDFTDPMFASNNTDPLEGWSAQKTLTCNEIATWMEQYAGLQKAMLGDGSFEPLDCSSVDPDGKTRTIIELVNRRQNEGDLDELHDTYYYRITINAQGDTTGQSLIQGVTGIQYN